METKSTHTGNRPSVVQDGSVELAVHTWLEPVLDAPEDKLPGLPREGVTAIEAGCPFFFTFPERVIAANCDALHRAGVRLWAVHAPFGSEYNLAHPDDQVRQRAVEVHKFVLKRADLGGASILVIHPGAGSGETLPEDSLPRLLASLEELLVAAEKTAVRLALENLAAHPIGANPEALRRVVEGFGSPSLGVCFDTGHAHLTGRLIQGLETLRDHIITFHLADNDGTRDLHVQPPYGSILWDEFARVFWELDFTDPVVIEARPWGGAGYGQQLLEVGALLRGELLTVEVGQRTVKVHCLRCGHVCLGSGDSVRCACSSRGLALGPSTT